MSNTNTNLEVQMAEMKSRAVSVREDTDQLIEQLARHLDRTKAAIVRLAVERLAQQELPNADFRRKETRECRCTP